MYPDGSFEPEVLRARDERLHAAIGSLPSPVREAIEGRYLRGLTYAEIAAQLGTGEHEARVLVADGCRQLLECRGEAKTPE